MTEPASGGKAGNFWSRRSTAGKGAIIASALIAVGFIAPLFGPEITVSHSCSPLGFADCVEDTRRVAGTFARDCSGCGDLKEFIRTSNAWCAWRGDTLLVHVRMTNESSEHVTVNWYPSYTIRGGGEHGSRLQIDGFAAGETRDLIAEQHPPVPRGSWIGECKPSFFLIESG